ncbi:MAG: AraC family ligand binding domain-containing protein [Lentisphaerales bacterium]|nr:AraC family ligand binding domain-containing protein [Lentisphaerales bacterium]
MESEIFKKEGFARERLIVLPRNLRVQLAADPFVRQLYLTDVGLFPHAHNHLVERSRGTNEFVVQFCFDGEGFSSFAAKTYKVSAGQFFVLPPNQQHTYGSSGKSGWKVGWIHLLGEGMQKFVDRLSVEEYGRAQDFGF